ncbi:hypothetical protein [Fulvimarina sp. MAC8]|uniref:hypothetical protein n=1 Tax=Fulvimarina sp. MAC8 TaxID=3162874 RepID=UPI0032EE6209
MNLDAYDGQLPSAGRRIFLVSIVVAMVPIGAIFGNVVARLIELSGAIDPGTLSFELSPMTAALALAFTWTVAITVEFAGESLRRLVRRHDRFLRDRLPEDRTDAQFEAVKTQFTNFYIGITLVGLFFITPQFTFAGFDNFAWLLWITCVLFLVVPFVLDCRQYDYSIAKVVSSQAPVWAILGFTLTLAL